MPISEVLWPEDRVDHIARHGVTPEEFEQVCFGLPLVLRAKAIGQNPVYYLLGETDAGRPLFCVVIEFPGSKAYPVTARDMTPKEKRRYAEWKKR
ncbi:MAG: BrnT family toxin [Candidatus Rokubacteria bacterium]|nr:BrnT family toxin [Candidatus Rokubacteria bacterium]